MLDSGMPEARSIVGFGKRLIREIKRDQVSNGAAALAFYMMLAVFPAAIFGLSLLPYLPIPHLTQAIFELLHQLIPRQAADLFTNTVQDITSHRNGGLLSFGLLFAVWSASTGLYAVMQQLNVVYDVEEERPFWKGRAIALLLMLIFFGLVVGAFALVIFGGDVQDWLGNQFGFSEPLLDFFAGFRWTMIAFGLLLAFALMYRMGPNVDRPFRLFSMGNLFACVGFLTACYGFNEYVGNFGSYDATYGSLGAVIVLLLWLFITGWVLLIGGEINQLREQTTRKREAKSSAPKDASQRKDGPDAKPATATDGPDAKRATATDVADAKPSRAKQGPDGRKRTPLRRAPQAPDAMDFDRREPKDESSRSTDARHDDPGKISVVVVAGLLANVAIAVSKYVAAAITHSSALLSEAIHSTADTGNELLLILGVKLSRKPADRLHPFGRGQEIYFWGLMVAVVLFGVGGGLSLYEGISHVLEPRPVENVIWSYVVLGCSLVFEGASFTIAARKMHAIAKARGETFMVAAHRSKNPQHFVVLFEDAAAILGVVIAFGGVFASRALNAPALDGVASIVIGLILATAALVLAYECRSLLIGEGADVRKVEDIRKIATRDPAVSAVSDPLTLYLGPEDVLLNLEVDFKDELDLEEVEASVGRLEHAIRERHPDVRKIFIEVTSLPHRA